MKPKPKLKSGAISESTAALNVDQSNTSAKCVDQKNATTGPSPSPLAPKPENGQDYPAAVRETGVSGSKAAPATTKKEAGLTKVLPADKKKIDARKKSLKRL